MWFAQKCYQNIRVLFWCNDAISFLFFCYLIQFRVEELIDEWNRLLQFQPHLDQYWRADAWVPALNRMSIKIDAKGLSKMKSVCFNLPNNILFFQIWHVQFGYLLMRPTLAGFMILQLTLHSKCRRSGFILMFTSLVTP